MVEVWSVMQILRAEHPALAAPRMWREGLPRSFWSPRKYWHFALRERNTVMGKASNIEWIEERIEIILFNSMKSLAH